MYKIGLPVPTYRKTGIYYSLTQRLGECQTRKKSNQESVAKFGAFKAMFTLLGTNEVELNADDVLYFNIEGADVDTSDEKDDE